MTKEKSSPAIMLKTISSSVPPPIPPKIFKPVYNLTAWLGLLYRRQKEYLRVRYEITFSISIILGSLALVAFLSLALATSNSALLPSALIICIVISLLFFVLIVVFKLHFWPADTEQNQVLYIESSSIIGSAKKIRFAVGNGNAIWLPINQRLRPFLEDWKFVVKDISVDDVVTTDEFIVSAKIDVVAHFNPDGIAFSETEVADIVLQGTEKLQEVLYFNIQHFAREAISAATYSTALQIPEADNQLRNLVAIPVKVIEAFATYTKDPAVRAFVIRAIDYRPSRPKDVEKQIQKHQGYIQGITAAFKKAAESGTLAQILFTHFATIVPLENLPARSRLPASAYKLDSQIAELFDSKITLQGEAQKKQVIPLPLSDPHGDVSRLHVLPPISQIASASQDPDYGVAVSGKPIDTEFWPAGEMPLMILCIEDQPAVSDGISRLLKRAGGYTLDIASTKFEALEKLQQNLYHILLCDINLNMQDEDDIGGIETLDELKAWGQLESYRIIVLSSKTQQMSRMFEAFHDSLDSFIPKSDAQKADKLLSVLKTSAMRSGANFKLKIGREGQEDADFESYLGWICNQIEIAPNKVVPSLPDYHRKLKETELLFRRLYTGQYQRIYVDAPAGDSYRGLATVRPILDDGTEIRTELVHLGYFSDIQVELNNFREHILQIGIKQYTTLGREIRTPWLKGVIYNFAAAVDSLITFKEFYEKTDNPEVVRQQLLVLFSAFDNWYVGDNRRFEAGGIPDYYMRTLRLDSQTIVQVAQNLDRNLRDGNVNVQSFSLENVMKWRIRLPKPRTIRTHGNLLAKNLLLGTENRSTGLATIYLIDFKRTGWGHPLQDFVRLEADLKLNAVPKEALNLETYFQVESSLILGDTLTTKIDKEAQKLHKTICYLREAASDALGRGYSFEPEEYLAALLFNIFDMMQMKDISETAHQRAAISANLLLRRLDLHLQ